ncbi:RNA 2',3'-cyclic phosphodiesterase [Nitratiruptor sp. YY09-18]|uniref:RNA 2',3'-cyclic phosphodiesterase n=1 Tax=Nitratiruptor sp. YY09-18 TaxID=2724901 RepID=UPI0019167E0E|nr:RNA 2',3'-cyclic phosphodiesterase [Nitratiruptor sp. YY09-18]BCD68722.1 RNA 2',3'-cyclic 3'-phosphodiesterase [Nitratiruptor sp. YY09-18]
MRLFIGSFAHIPKYQEIKNSFSFLEGKWVEKRNLHLTYIFLGEIETPKLITQKLENFSPNLSPLKIEGLGFFGNPAKILYAKVDDQSLSDVVKTLQERLTINIDKPFIPHITLCRIKKVHNFKRFVTTVKSYEKKELGFIEPKIQLIQSILTPKGPRYIPLHSFI